MLTGRPATCFPPAVATGSTWDPELLRRMGEALGDECRAMDVAVLLGPGINLKRSPLGGRDFEYFSEDPLLTGVLAAEWVLGLQSRDVGASLKHYAVNSQETDRMRVSADVDERTLRELYLRAFQRVVTQAQPWTVMCAYNKVNGVYASQHRWLLTDVLRGEWGFDGLVVSDWGAVADRTAAVAAGLDLTMPGPADPGDRELVEAVRRRAARPGAAADGGRPRPRAGRAGGRAAARRIRRRGPPRAGPRDRRPRHRAAQERRRHPAAGGRTAPVHRGHRRVRPHPALPGRRQLADDPDPAGRRADRDHRRHAGDGPLRARLPDRRHRRPGGRRRGRARRREDQDLLAEAVALAAASDVALVFVGSTQETEGADRDGIDLRPSTGS